MNSSPSSFFERLTLTRNLQILYQEFTDGRSEEEQLQLLIENY